MSGRLSPRNAFVAGVITILALVPVYAEATGNTFMVSLFTRIVILAIAAVSLNLIMGFGGMVSFGHAVYLGIGGYAVGILAKEGIDSGLLLFFNELVRLLWGPAGLTLSLPPEMLSAVEVLPGVYYPLYRLVIILATLTVALLLYALVMRTRIGMLIRAGASNREMVGALGVNIKLLYTLVFGLGAALAGFAGMMQAPLAFVQIGMGQNILILAFVVIIIGGIGSIRGAFVAAIIVGIIDTIGRAFLPDLIRHFVSYSAGSSAGPALSSMLIYTLMAAVLVFRPEGLFPAARR